MTEKQLHEQICTYINAQYPKVIYLSDMSGSRVTIGLRQEIKAKTCRGYKLPDLIILHPNGGYHGLIIEIKASFEDLYKKDGSYKKSEHIEAQIETINRLRYLGYCADFAHSFESAKVIIDGYMLLPQKSSYSPQLLQS